MRVVKRHINTGNYEFVKYPRKDLEPIIGLDSNIKFYVIIEHRPTYNVRTHKITEGEPVFNDEPYEGKTHLGTFTKTFNIIQLPNEQIITNLNQSLSEYCDTSYPVWQRLKHHNEANYLLYDSNFAPRSKADLTPEQQQRFDYILSLGEWLNRCRADRDNREKELLMKGTLPSFDWEVMPLN